MADEDDEANLSSSRPLPPLQTHHTVSFASATSTSSSHHRPPHDDEEAPATATGGAAAAGGALRRPSLEPLNVATASSSVSNLTSGGPSAPPSPLSRVQSQATRTLSRWATSLKNAWQWKERPPGPRDVDPSVRAFHTKLLNASRPALACFLATGVSMIYPWSNKVTWFSITLSISGVGHNLGHTVEGIWQQWLGTAVAVPLCFFLKLFAFSKELTALAVFLVSVAIAGTALLSEAAKKLCLIFITWDVLVPVVAAGRITIESLMVDLLKAVLGANIVCIFVMLVPVPHLAVWMCRWRLEELQEVMGRFLEDAVDSFCLQDDSGLHDLEDVIQEAAALLREIRALLPDTRFELSLLGGGCWRRDHRTKVAYDRLVRYLAVLEGQMENFRGIAVALSDLYPNATHSEFVTAMRPSLLELVVECKAVLQGMCYHVCHALRVWTPCSLSSSSSPSYQRKRARSRSRSWSSAGTGTTATEDISVFEGDGVPAELFWPPKVVLAQVLHELLKVRMRVVYGVELKARVPRHVGMPSMEQLQQGSGSFNLVSPTSIVFERSAQAEAAAQRFHDESARVGYMNLLPRNAFVLDLKLFVEAFATHHALCNSTTPPAPPPPTAWWAVRTYRWLCRGPGPGWKSWRQPLKVGLAILLSSIVVLVDDAHLGLQTIWCPITVAQTMSSHPSSAFKSGANRIQGTVLGAVMGLAVTTWAPIHDKAVIVLVLTLWVFVCAFNRGSPTYGEVAVSAALTAPIVVVGPVIGSSGAVVRISQVILGTVIYVAVDNLLFPTRAKLLLRTQLCQAVQDLLRLCADGLATFRATTANTRLATTSNGENGSSTYAPPDATAVAIPAADSKAEAAAAEVRMQEGTEAIRQALLKEALYISLATDEPELWHKPFQREAYQKVLVIQLHMHRYLLMLHRAAASFPTELAEWDLAMLQAYESIIHRLQRTVEAVFTEALARLQSLKTASSLLGGSKASQKGKLGGSNVLAAMGNGVNVFQIRQEFRDIQDSIDNLVTDYFAKDPVLTSLNFIVPLNGMIYSTRKMSAECVKFVQAVRELMLREKKIGKGKKMVTLGNMTSSLGSGLTRRVGKGPGNGSSSNES